MNILLFLAVLVVLIVVHEWGHFLAARFFGIKVEEFGIGYPPRAWRIGKIGETVYTINWLPFGGFVKIFGESLGTDVPESEKNQALVTQAWWKQAIVFVAGVTFNWIFAFLLFTIAFMMGSPLAVDESQINKSDTDTILAISNVLHDSPADIAGLKSGDSIVALVSGENTVEAPLPSEVSDFMATNAGETVQVFYKRMVAGKEVTGNVDIIPSHGVLADKQSTPAIGIEMVLISSERQNFVNAVLLGAQKTYNATIAITKGTFEFIISAITGKADWQTVAGPVGIVGLVGDASRLGLVHLLNFTAIISINLAIINLLPVPALDGGRLLFAIIEGVTRRKINGGVANVLNIIGFTSLIILMIIITWNDIIKIVS